MLPKPSSFAEYGGAIKNYSNVVDPTTDEPAIVRNRYVCDASMMTRTSPRAIATFVGANGANPTEPPSGYVHDAHWGNAPGVKPNFVRFGEGIVDITYPTTVSTPLTSSPVEDGGGETVDLNFRRAYAQVQTGGTLKHAMAEVTAPNVVRVYCYLANGTLDDLPGALITVWIF